MPELEIILTGLISAMLADPNIRSSIEQIIIKVIADLTVKRNLDTAKFDATFLALAQAKTPEELKNAHLALQSLMASS